MLIQVKCTRGVQGVRGDAAVEEKSVDELTLVGKLFLLSFRHCVVHAPKGG